MGSDAGTSLTVDGAVGIGFNIPETGRQYLVAGRLEYGRTFLVRFRDETRCFQVVNKLLLSERLVVRVIQDSLERYPDLSCPRLERQFLLHGAVPAVIPSRHKWALGPMSA